MTGRSRVRLHAVALVIMLATLFGPTGALAAEGSARRSSAEVAMGRWVDLRVGMTTRAAIATGKVRRNASPCGTTNLIHPWDERGYLWISRGRLRRISLFTARDQTRGEVGVGSTLRQVRRAHPGVSGVRHRTIEGYRFPYVVLQRSGRTLTFQFRADARTTPRMRARVLTVSGPRPFILWEAC